MNGKRPIEETYICENRPVNEICFLASTTEIRGTSHNRVQSALSSTSDYLI